MTHLLRSGLFVSAMVSSMLLALDVAAAEATFEPPVRLTAEQDHQRLLDSLHIRELKQLVGHLDNSSYPLINVDIQLTLTTPANASGPVPVMMELGVSPEVQAAIRKRFTDAQWAAYQGTGPSWQSLLLARGWGYAILIPTSVQADNGAGLTQGVIGLTNKGQPLSQPVKQGTGIGYGWGDSKHLAFVSYQELPAPYDSASSVRSAAK
jgi:hypothetical protein